MGFFEVLVDPDEDVWDPFDEIDQPAPYVGGAIPINELMAKTDEAAVILRDLVAHSTGFQFTILSCIRGETLKRIYQNRSMHFAHGPRQADLLRIGLQFSDGRRAANIGVGSDDFEIRSDGGGGSDATWEEVWKVDELPAEGDLTFVCEWPIVEIIETRFVFDASLVLAASRNSRPVWSDAVGTSPRRRFGQMRAVYNADYETKQSPGDSDDTA